MISKCKLLHENIYNPVNDYFILNILILDNNIMEDSVLYPL